MKTSEDDIDIIVAEINKIINDHHEKKNRSQNSSLFDDLDMTDFLAKLEFDNIQLTNELHLLKTKMAQKHEDLKNPPTAIEKKLRELEKLVSESRKHIRKIN